MAASVPDTNARLRLSAGIVRRFRDDFRSAKEIGLRPIFEFWRARRSAEYQAAYEKQLPLVSICTATYNRADLLVSRSVRSSLGQTYRNIEVIVVGDGCTDDTAARMAEIKDSRLRFVNLEQRGDYPGDPELRWMVAGANPINHAFALARGDFITQLDDDDIHTPDRVEKLVSFIKQTRADLAYHPFAFEQPSGEWQVNDAQSFQHGRVTSSSLFYHRWFVNYPIDPTSILRFREPGDWNRMRKCRYLGARIRRHSDIMLRHFRERSQKS